jgi:hypothetical protein
VGSLEAFRSRVREVAGTALECRAGGDPRWDALLRSLGLEPPRESQRLALLAAAPLRRGVLPVELRAALEALKEAIERDAPGPELRAELAGLVEREMTEYLRRVRPPQGLAGIFANAQATTIRHADTQDGVATRKCDACGAARPEGTDLRKCAYCGGDLFPRETRE